MRFLTVLLALFISTVAHAGVFPLSNIEEFMIGLDYEYSGEYQKAYKVYEDLYQKDKSPYLYSKMMEVFLSSGGDPEQAYLKLQEACKLYPNDGELLLKLGYIATALAQKSTDNSSKEYLAEAKGAFLSAARNAPSEKTYSALAVFSHEYKDYALAYQMYYKLIDDYGITAYYYNLGLLKIEQGDETTALKYMNNAADNGSYKALSYLTDYALEKQDTDMAIEFLQREKELGLDLATTNIILGNIYLYYKKDYDEAISSYTQAANNIEGKYKINLLKEIAAIAYNYRKDYKQSLYFYKQALEYDPEDSQLYYYAANVARLVDPLEAEKLFNTGLAKFPDFTALKKEASIHYSYMAEYPKALAMLDKIPYEDRDANFYYIKAEVYKNSGENSKAEQAYLTGLKENPYDENLYAILAIFYDDSGQFEKTVNILKKGLIVLPNSPVLQNFLGYLYADRDIHISYAEELIDRALKQDPKNCAYLDSKAWLLYRKGEIKEAYDIIIKVFNPCVKGCCTDEVEKHYNIILKEYNETN